MIRDAAVWNAWEQQWIRSEKPNLQRNLALLEAMYEHARRLGAFPPANLLEGLELKIKLAKVFSV